MFYVFVFINSVLLWTVRGQEPFALNFTFGIGSNEHLMPSFNLLQQASLSIESRSVDRGTRLCFWPRPRLVCFLIKLHCCGLEHQIGWLSFLLTQPQVPSSGDYKKKKCTNSACYCKTITEGTVTGFFWLPEGEYTVTVEVPMPRNEEWSVVARVFGHVCPGGKYYDGKQCVSPLVIEPYQEVIVNSSPGSKYLIHMDVPPYTSVASFYPVGVNR